MDVPHARRIARPAWINARTVLGLLLFSTSVVMGQRVLAAAEEGQLVWSAVTDLPQGAVISEEDLIPIEVDLSGTTLAGYATVAEELSGRALTRPVAAGELIALGSLGDSATAGVARAITIPLSSEHAVGGDLRPGDLVDIYATFDAGDIRARTTLLARSVGILDLVESSAIAFEETPLIGLTVGVSPEDAARLAFAIRTAEIDVVKVTGSDRTSRSSTVRGSDFP